VSRKPGAIQELVEMAKKFREAASRGEQLGLTEDEVRFYDALATNESAVKELTDETLKKIAHELTENLRQNLTVDWSERESVPFATRMLDVAPSRRAQAPVASRSECGRAHCPLVPCRSRPA